MFLFSRRTFRGDFDSPIHITRLVGRGEETYLQKKPSLKQYISSTQQHHHHPYTQLFISQELFGVERSSSYCSKCKNVRYYYSDIRSTPTEAKEEENVCANTNQV